MNKLRPIPATFKKERRKSKAMPLRKLILTGSLMAKAQFENAYPERSIGDAWNELLDECREKGVA